MNVALHRPMSRDEFLDWAEAQDARYEFDGVQPVEMLGGNLLHDRLRRRLTRLIEDRLAGTSFELFGPDAGVATVGRAVRYPDVVIASIGNENKSKVLAGSVVVFEVLSPSSHRTDRLVKVREYGAVPSIRRHVIVEQDSIGLTVLDKLDAGNWRKSILTDGTLHLPEAGISLAVADLYDGLDIPAA